MADWSARIEAEYDNIRHTLSALPATPLKKLSQLELAGVAALLHNFYNGLENILRQVFQARGITVPDGSSWHRDLLLAARENGILPRKLTVELSRFLAFRHFFSHSYALDLVPGKMAPLAAGAEKVFQQFQAAISRQSLPPSP
jgi:hypothetical protein